jgi:PTS system galactitol-specific IIA component
MGNVNFNDENKKQDELSIEENLILVKEKVTSQEEIIHKLGSMLFENGFVRDTYTQAVLDREIEYPTGLQARVTGVAIPHTDTEHVLKPAVAIATLKDPIIFNGMGMPDTKVKVDIILMLAIHDPKLVVRILRKVIFILEDDDALEKMLFAKTKSEIKDIMFNHIRSLSEK